MRRVVVIGGGIIGLAVAWELTRRGTEVTVLEKEDQWPAHQTGHNSNVVHAGLYYKPGSFKARMSVAGNASIVGFARERGVPVDVCGKLVVATSESELPALAVLAERAETNGVPATLVSPEQAREYKPEVACAGELRGPAVGSRRAPGRPHPSRAHRSVPRGVLRIAAGAQASGARADLSGAGRQRPPARWTSPNTWPKI